MVETKEALLVNKLAGMRVNTTEYRIIRNTLSDDGKVLLKKIKLKQVRDRTKQKSIDNVDNETFDDDEEEIWKDINEFDNYSVSSKGRVINKMTNKILKSVINHHGYFFVNLYNDRKHYNKTIHQLVADAFLNKKR
jgi:hypothetical protein